MGSSAPSSATVLEVVDTLGPASTPVTTSEVAQKFDCTQRTVYNRLDALVDDGALKTKKVGARARVWWRPAHEQPRTERYESSSEFRSLIQAVEEYAIFRLDPCGYIVSWNDGAERIKGYEYDEIVGEHVSVFYTDEAVTHGIPEQNLEHAEADGSITDDGWRVRKDGSQFWANVTISSVTDEQGEFRGYIKVTRDMTDEREHERQLERQHEALQRELDDVYERIDDAVYGLDEEWRFTHVNERAEQLLGRTEEELLGNVVWEEFPDAVGMDVYHNYHEAVETQESVRFEEYFPVHDRWYDVRTFPSETGLSIHFLDVTERKQRERNLERYEAIIEAVGDPVYALDTQRRFTFVNRALAERLGYDESELLGQSVSIGMDADDIARTASVIAEILADDPEETATVECEVISNDGERISVENHISLLTDEDGRFRGSAGVLRDVTARNERERELEEAERRYRTLVDNFPNGAVTLVDEELRYIIVGGTPIIEVNESVEALEGNSIREILPSDFVDVFVPRYVAALDGESSTFEAEFGDRYYQFTILPVRDESGAVFAALGMSQDVTERKEYERELEKRIRQQEVITDLGQQALENRDLDTLLVEAAELVANTLDNDYCKVLELDTDAEELLLRQGVGWEDGVVGSVTVSAVENDSQAAYTLASRHPIVVEDLETDSRFSGPELLTSHDVRSGISTTIGPYDDPWGILGTHDTAPKEFTEQDVNFVQAIANILATAINRHDDEQVLARQRELLAALVHLNGIGRGITDAVIEQSTREEIEQVVCEQLTATGSYTGAWITDVDQRTNELRPRAEAGIENLLDSIDPSANPDETIGQRPVREALRTGNVRVSRDAQSVFRCDQSAETVEFRSFAAIPIVHGETVYGVIGVHSERAGAFNREEREIVGQLGEVVGHAITGVEQKRALLSDTVTELELKIRNFFEMLENPVEGTITITRAIPIGNGGFLVYGTATEDAVDSMKTLVETESVPHWESITVLGTDGADRRFELRLAESTLLSTAADHGGQFREATIEGGDCYVTLHLAPSTDVQRVIERIEHAHPSIELVTRHQTVRSARSPKQFMHVLSDHLTDRQQVALEAGYFAGFFDYPRDSSGEEVAASLGISSSTFHQHIRKAEKKLLDEVFAET